MCIFFENFFQKVGIFSAVPAAEAALEPRGVKISELRGVKVVRPARAEAFRRLTGLLLSVLA